jgi:hypothetical protein
MRCRPLRSRCRPLSLGFSIMMASLGCIRGGDEDISFTWSSTTESIDRGSMVEVVLVCMVRGSTGKRVVAGRGTERRRGLRMSGGLLMLKVTGSTAGEVVV